MAYLLTYRHERKENREPTNQTYKTQSEPLSRNVKMEGSPIKPGIPTQLFVQTLEPDGYFFAPRVPCLLLSIANLAPYETSL